MSERSSVAIAADDLTGAADTAAVFAQAGWRARIVLDPSRLEPTRLGLAQALDTHSRADGLDSPLVSAVVAHLAAADVAFLKIDSLLRGRWASDLCAVAAAGPWSRVVVAPAFPARGRIVRDGRVGGRAALENVRAAGAQPVHVALAELRANASALARAGVLVVDGETDDDLRRVVAAPDRPTLWVGSAGLAHALAGEIREPPRSTRSPRPVVTIVGSRTPAARAQVDEALRLDESLRHADLDPARLREGDASWTSPLTIGADLVVTIADDLSANGEGDPTLVERLAAALSPHDERIGSLVIVGGQTARATLVALGLHELDVTGELEPGIALCADTNGRAVITKSGSFGDDASLHRIHRSLRA